MRKKIIACDFDGTLCSNRFPEIGEPNLSIINQLIDEKKLGTRIILWTCRENEILDNAIEWCEQFGLNFDSINDNLPEIKELMKYNSRKIYADEYWDDRGKKIQV